MSHRELYEKCPACKGLRLIKGPERGWHYACLDCSETGFVPAPDVAASLARLAAVERASGKLMEWVGAMKIGQMDLPDDMLVEVNPKPSNHPDDLTLGDLRAVVAAVVAAVNANGE